MEKKIRLKKDFIIPAGTIFETADGESVHHINGVYKTLIGLGKDNTMSVSLYEDISDDIKDIIELIEE